MSDPWELIGGSTDPCVTGFTTYIQTIENLQPQLDPLRPLGLAERMGPRSEQTSAPYPKPPNNLRPGYTCVPFPLPEDMVLVQHIPTARIATQDDLKQPHIVGHVVSIIKKAIKN